MCISPGLPGGSAVKILFFSLPGPASAGCRRLGIRATTFTPVASCPAHGLGYESKIVKERAHARAHARTHTYYLYRVYEYTGTRPGWTWTHMCGLPGVESSGPASRPSPPVQPMGRGGGPGSRYPRRNIVGVGKMRNLKLHTCLASHATFVTGKLLPNLTGW